MLGSQRTGAAAKSFSAKAKAVRLRNATALNVNPRQSAWAACQAPVYSATYHRAMRGNASARFVDRQMAGS
jgi:hypothetical protein